MSNIPSNLRSALAEWDRLRYPKDVMRAEGISFGDVLTLRGNAVDRLIEAVRESLSGDSSAPETKPKLLEGSFNISPDERDALRYRWLRDWVLREGKRSEIDPYGHIAVRTVPEWERLLDEAMTRSSAQETKPECLLSGTGRHSTELGQRNCAFCGAVTVKASEHLDIPAVQPDPQPRARKRGL